MRTVYPPQLFAFNRTSTGKSWLKQWVSFNRNEWKSVRSEHIVHRIMNEKFRRCYITGINAYWSSPIKLRETVLHLKSYHQFSLSQVWRKKRNVFTIDKINYEIFLVWLFNFSVRKKQWMIFVKEFSKSRSVLYKVDWWEKNLRTIFLLNSSSFRSNEKLIISCISYRLIARFVLLIERWKNWYKKPKK